MNRKVWFKEEELIKGDTIMSLLLAPHQEEKKGGGLDAFFSAKSKLMDRKVTLSLLHRIRYRISVGCNSMLSHSMVDRSWQ